MTHIGKEAQIILPGTSFAEKDGTFTSMERRIQKVRQAIDPVGESRPDWKILCDLSTRMGYAMTYQSPDEVMKEIMTLVPVYSEALTAVSDRRGPQWPLKERRGGGKKSFRPVEYEEPAEYPNDTYPLLIVPGGFHYPSWIGTTTKRAMGLAKVYPEPHVRIHPDDASREGLREGDQVRVGSPRGAVETVCCVSEHVPKGVAYLAIFFFPVFFNSLLSSSTDPESHGFEYKRIIGRVTKR